MPTNDSLYNTPNCWSIYCCGKVFQYLLAHGGLEAMAKRNEEKAAILYDFLDHSHLFTGAVRKEDRSVMNVPFVTPTKEQDAAVVAACKAAVLTISRATRAWAACVLPSTTPCPARAWKLWWRS